MVPDASPLRGCLIRREDYEDTERVAAWDRQRVARA